MIKRRNNKQNKKPRVLQNIYKTKYNTYSIDKSINGKTIHFKTCKTIDEAIQYRNRLKENNWQPLPPTPEEIYREKQHEYYKHIQLTCTHRQYQVTNKNYDYIGNCNSLTEALYYRDLYLDKTVNEAPRPSTIDLITNNPYTLNNLKYPIPERLKPKKKTRYGQGSIRCNGEFHYSIYHGGKKNSKRFVCSCRTYEQAYYVREEMNKCNWDRTQLQRILDDYPIWYTKLMEFYRYIHLDYEHKKRTGELKYKINIPLEYLPEDKQLLHFTGYSNVEDALYERDFLMEHNWDYDYLVEAIDDTDNPYYDMVLPPYPQRRILNISIRDYHEKELTTIHELIQQNPEITQLEICETLGLNEVTLRNWLKKFWNTSMVEFRRISLSGENPINVLEKVPQIYTPDLSRPKPPNFKGYIQYCKRESRSPYKIVKDNIRYGSYHTLKQAKEAVKKLKACQWDKNKVPDIQKSVGWTPQTKRGNIYPANKGKGWSIRHKDKNRRMINYGYYTDFRIATAVRDLLRLHNWNKEELENIRDIAEETIKIFRLIESNMFTGVYDPSILNQMCMLEEAITENNHDSKYDLILEDTEVLNLVEELVGK